MSSDAGLSTVAEGAASEARVGQVVAGKYHLDRLLGEGGMGAVYAAKNLWTGRRVAVKLLRPELLSKPDTVRRFLQEARSASKIEHPNIVQVFDMGQDEADGTLFIVQELLEGADLSHRLKQSPRLTLAEVSAILMPILDALEAAHAQSIIHRDLKPGNIFLSVRAGGVVAPKLIDFGISKVLDDDGFQKTRTGTTVGTPYYMSPEQARGDSSLDVRTDVWSIAAVLFEALCGRGPFEASNYNQLIIKIVTEPPPRIESLAPETPRDLADALHAALEPELDKRLPTIRAFRDALLGCASFRGAQPEVPRAIGPRTASLPQVSSSGESPIAHLDTLPSSLPPHRTDLDRSVPGQPVTVSPTLRGHSAIAFVGSIALFVLLASFGLHLTKPRVVAQRRPPPEELRLPTPQDSQAPQALQAPPPPQPQAPRNGAYAAHVRESQPPLQPPPPLSAVVAVAPAVPAPAMVVNDAGASGRARVRPPSRPLRAPPGTDATPTTLSNPANPGDNLRPSLRYPGGHPN